MPVGTVKIQAQLDTKKAESSFDKFTKEMKRPVTIPLSEVVGKIGKIGQILEKVNTKSIYNYFDKMEKEATKRSAKIGSKIGKGITKSAGYAGESISQAKINQSFQGGMKGASSVMGSLQSLKSGDFGSVIGNAIGGITSAKDKIAGKYGEWKQKRYEKEQARKEKSEHQSGQPHQSSSIRGGLFSSVGSGIMVVEGIAKAVGFLTNLASQFGQKHIEAMGSQAGTIGATGSYVGGGGGNFANAQIAQGKISYNRALGKSGTDGGSFNQNLADMRNYAASQNMGFSELSDVIGELANIDQKLTPAFVKGAAEATKVTGLKQGEYIKKLGSIIVQTREGGYGKLNVNEFAGISARAGNAFEGAKLDPSRALGFTQSLDQSVRKGEKGGIMGQLAIARRLQSGEAGNIFEAIKMGEKGIVGDDVDYLNKLTKNDYGMGGYILRNEGHGTQTESEAFLRGQNQKINPLGIGGAEGSISTRMQNEEYQTFASKTGAGANAAVFAEKNHEILLKMASNETLNSTLKTLVNGMSKTEETLISGVEKTVGMVESGIKSMTKFFEDINKDGTPMKNFAKLIGAEIKKALGF